MAVSPSSLLCTFIFMSTWSHGAAQASSGAVAEGDKLLRAGQFKAAIQQYSLGATLDPENYVPIFKRSSVHTVLGDKHAALRDLGEVIRLNPSLKQAREKRAALLTARGQLEEAASDLQALSNLGGDQAVVGQKISEMQQVQAHISRAKELAAAGSNAQETKHHVDIALQTCTESTELLMMSVRSNLDLGNNEQVIVDTGRLIKLDRGNIVALALRAKAYYAIGELDSALKHLREGLRHDPEHKESQKVYKVLRKVERKVKAATRDFEAGEWADAINAYQGALKEDPDHRVYQLQFNLKICEANKNLKQGEAARVACDKALQVEPRSVEALLLRSEAKKLEEDFQGSLDDLREAKKYREGDRGIDQKIHEAQKVLEQSKRKNYYKILGVKRLATDREIKRAYRKLALQHHPDKVKEEDKKKAEKIFRDMAEAYGVLSNEELRGKYDRGEDVSGQAQQQQGGGFPFPGGFPFGGGGGGQQFHFHFG